MSDGIRDGWLHQESLCCTILQRLKRWSDMFSHHAANSCPQQSFAVTYTAGAACSAHDTSWNYSKKADGISFFIPVQGVNAEPGSKCLRAFQAGGRSEEQPLMAAAQTLQMLSQILRWRMKIQFVEPPLANVRCCQISWRSRMHLYS